MDIHTIHHQVEGIPGMPLYNAIAIEKIIRAYDVHRVLELGMLHGVSSCYMAAVMQDLEGKATASKSLPPARKVVTIDLRYAESLTPNVKQLASRLGVADYIEPYFEPTSYNWRLMQMIEAGQHETFDLCYIDGAHNWYDDGLAFFLADKLLKPGGVMIFDDMPWTYDASPTLRQKDWVRDKPEIERTTPQVEKIFNLLVRQHPSYAKCRIQGAWGIAEKIGGAGPLYPELL